MRRCGRIHPRAIILLVTAVYAALALASTWPLAAKLGAALPLGSGDAATVPLVSAWTLWWTSDRVAHGFRDYWDAPIFHPAKATFALSEPMPLAGLAATPLLALGASPALAHNLFLLLSLVLNGVLGFLVCRQLRLGGAISAAGGALLLLLPYVHHQLGVLALVPLAGVLGTLLAVLRCARRPTLLRGAAAGLAFACTFLLCAQYALLLALALVACIPVLVQRSALGAHGARTAAAAILVSAALAGPFAYAQHSVLASHHFGRSVARAVDGSATAKSWWRTPWPDPIPLPGLASASPPYKRSLFPGSVRLALACAGAFWGLRSRGRRRTTRFLVALVLAGVLLSVFARLDLGPASPYRLARAVVPGLAAMRSLWRAGVLAQIALAVLAAQGLHLAWLKTSVRARRRPARSTRKVRALRALVVALGLLAVGELWPPAQALAHVPAQAQWQPWLDWVRARVPDGEPIAWLPFPQDGRVRSYQATARFMYLATFHRRPIVNGYSSYFPFSYDRLLARMRGESGVDSAALYAAGVRVVVVDRRKASRVRLPGTWRKTWSDPRLGIDVYEHAARLRQ